MTTLAISTWKFDDPTEVLEQDGVHITDTDALERATNILYLRGPFINGPFVHQVRIIAITSTSFTLAEELHVSASLELPNPNQTVFNMFVYRFDREEGLLDRMFNRIRSITLAYAMAYPNIASDEVKAYMASPLSLV